MSFLTATNTEVIYNMPANGPDVTVTTANQYITANSSSLAAYLPPLFSIWQPSTISGKGIKVVLAGTANIGGANTIAFTYGLNTAQGTNGTAPTGVASVAASGAMTGVNSTTQAFRMEFDIVFQGANSTASGDVGALVNGVAWIGTANNASTAGTTWALVGGKSTTGTPGQVVFVGTTAYFWECVVTVATTAPTHFILNQHTIYGLN